MKRRRRENQKRIAGMIRRCLSSYLTPDADANVRQDADRFYCSYSLVIATIVEKHYADLRPSNRKTNR